MSLILVIMLELIFQRFLNALDSIITFSPDLFAIGLCE